GDAVMILPRTNLLIILRVHGEPRSLPEFQPAVVDSTLAHPLQKDPEVVYADIRRGQDAAMAGGCNVARAPYRNALKTGDGYLGEIMDAVESRENYETEEWLVAVTSNHGGTGTTIGGGSLSERNIFAIYHYKDFQQLELIPSFIEAPEFYQSGSNQNYTAPVFEASSPADYNYNGDEMTVEFRYKRNIRHPWVGEPMIIGQTGRTS